MSIRVGSGLWDVVRRMYGLVGQGGGSPSTYLADGIINQTVDLNPAVRRGLAPISSEGWFYGAIQTNLTMASPTRITTVNPYQSGAEIPPWTDPIPQGLEVWLEGAWAELSVGGGAATSDFAFGVLWIDAQAQDQGFGENSTGGLTATLDIPIARFDAATNGSGTNAAWTVDDLGRIYQPLGIRLRRDRNLSLRASANNLQVGETMDVTCGLLLGLMPIGLGSDVAK